MSLCFLEQQLNAFLKVRLKQNPSFSSMPEALPYKSWLPIYTLNPSSSPSSSSSSSSSSLFSNKNSSSHFASRQGSKADDLKDLVSENALIVFARRGCCMTHVVKRLLQGLGVNPVVYEVDEHDETDVIKELVNMRSSGDGVDPIQFPAVFIGGRFFGGLDRIMATHITGELTPVLKQAGALWL